MAEEVVVKVLTEAALAGQFDQPADIYGHKVLEKQPCSQNTQRAVQIILYLRFCHSTRDAYAANAALINISILENLCIEYCLKDLINSKFLINKCSYNP